MRFPPAQIQLRRAQLVLILAVLVPTVLLTVVGILLLVIAGTSAFNIVIGVLVLIFCTTAITGYILGALYVGLASSVILAAFSYALLQLVL